MIKTCDPLLLELPSFSELRCNRLLCIDEDIHALEAELLEEYSEEMERKNYSPLWEWDEVSHREQLRKRKKIFSSLYSCVQQLQQEQDRLEAEEKRISEKYKKIINLHNRLKVIQEALIVLFQIFLVILLAVLAAPILLVVTPFKAFASFLKRRAQGD